VREVEGHVAIGGRQMFFRDIGEGPPVVLFNGIGAHVEMWRPLERALKGLRVISFDAPGTGRSQNRPLPFTMGALAKSVVALLDQLELERADIVGYSFGGALAQQFALQAPERVRRLVLASTLPGWGGVPGQLKALLPMISPLRYYVRPFYERTAGMIAGGRARHDSEYVTRLWLDRSGHPPTLRGYTFQLWAMSLWSSLPWLDRIQAPTLVVVGDDDPLVPISNALMIAAHIPQARVFVAAGEGHFLLLDEHTAASSVILEFLGAERFEETSVWRSSAPVDQAQVAEQMRVDGLGALPWGVASAGVRLLLR
jgi:poly(3-hydroxyoctanoate) depolymerase